MRRCLILLSLIASTALMVCLPASAASIENLVVTPDRATANSIYAFSFVWQDDEGRAPNSLQIQLGANEPIILYFADEEGNPQPGLLDPTGAPLVISDGRPANEGTTYFIRATAGLHFILQDVDPVAGRRIHPQDPSLIYLDYLTAEDNGAPRTLRFEARAVLITPPEEEGGEAEIENVASEDADEPSFTIYNTFRFNAFVVPQPRAVWREIYAGRFATSPPYLGVDTVSGYAGYPDPLDTDPLSTIGPRPSGVPESPDNEFEPDDGSSSTAYVFRVVYSNAGNLPPRQWLPPGAFGGSVADRRGVFWSMGLTPEEWALVSNYEIGVVLFITRADIEDSEYVALPMQKEDPGDNDYTNGVIYRYVFGPSGRSLANGTYKYFFATSDDFIRDGAGDVPDWLDVLPFAPGTVSGNGGNLRVLGSWNEDDEVYEPMPPYVDRPAHQPGYTSSYPYSALEHPRVTLGLDGPNSSHSILYLSPLPNSAPDGTARPIRTAIQPDTGSPGPMVTSDTELNFQIEYSQLYGIRPDAGSGGEISVWVDPGTPSERRYALSPTAVLGSDIVEGVMYQTPTPVLLSPGRHRYRFTASDGSKRAFYPVLYSEGEGPTTGTRSVYVNTRPRLSEVAEHGGTVSPSLGTAGDNFRYMIRYTDADNQKPYQANLWVKYADADSNLPELNEGFIAVAAGGAHSLGLKEDGSVVGWGSNAYGECDVPQPNAGFTAIAAGGAHSLGLKEDGSVVGWGSNSFGQCDVPDPNGGFVAISAGMGHSLGLKADGTVVAWGLNSFGQCDVPDPNVSFTAIAAGGVHSLGLKADGTIVGWGSNAQGQRQVTGLNEDFAAISAGKAHSLGLKTNGTVRAWGSNSFGQCSIPSPNAGFTKISAGGAHSLGLKNDGSVVAWGNNDQGQCDVPLPNQGFSDVSAGEWHSLLLRPLAGSLGAVVARGGSYERVQMYKLDPADTDYTDGCIYIYDSANLIHKLEPGMRGHYFEFADDWGWREDPHSRVLGETVYYPGPTFRQGPFITPNDRPVMTNGVAMAEDGTSNPATLWSYKVRYTDPNNHAPSYVNLYIGKAIRDSGGNIVQIVWDYGSPMVETNPDDRIYSDGKDYAYSTRLDSVEPGDIFYYTFVASDGIDVALYNPITSPSTGSVYDPWVKPPFDGDYPPGIERIEPVPDSDGKLFQIPHAPLVGEIPLTPINKLYRFPIVYNAEGRVLSYFGEYSVDFINATIGLQEASDYIDVQYWFANEGPVVQFANAPPSLESGRVTPDPGRSTDTFTFSVIYKDPDGRFGQAPSYIRVVVDGQPTDMTPTSGGGLDYRSGVRFQATMRLSVGAHLFYFEASDGSAYAVFDKNGGRSSNQVIVNHTPIVGPYVNDPPTLTQATVFPRGQITIGQGVTYSVIYTDSSNEPPDSGYPVVYVDNPTEVDRSGVITAISGPVITSAGSNWQTNEFAGMPVEITPAGLIYRVQSNTANTLTVVASDVYADGGRVGHPLQIGRLTMMKSDPSDNTYTDGVLYQAQVPSLGPGAHTAHFRVRTTEVIGPDGLTRVSSVREPTGLTEIEGPFVLDSAPPGNQAPVLSAASVTPTTGLSSDTFTFAVTYRDPDGDAPESRPVDGVLGYVRLIIDNDTVLDMLPPALPNYLSGAVMTKQITGLSGGAHRYHFEASDGYYVVRLPAIVSQFYTFNVNRRPVLSEPQVSPAKGNLGRPFTYSVIYTDLDGNAPQSIKLHIDGDAEGIEIKGYAVMPPGSQYRDGILYAYTLPAGTLAIGEEHSFYFTANDGLESAVPTEVIVGPTVHSNLSPSLTQGAVLPAEGWDTDTYTYTVRYSDPNGDEPEFVRVYIDGSGSANARLMTKVGDSNDFESGVVYSFAKEGLSPGTHTYFFEASDWLEVVTDPASGFKTGPTVTRKPTATITIQASSNPRIGQPLTISGTISPAMSVPITLRITQPNGSVSTRTLVSQANGAYSHTFTPQLSGVWKAVASWVGNSSFAPSSSRELQVAVEGPTFTVSGLHMISVPLNVSNGYPDGAFGRTPPFALAKWSPSQALYKFYSLLPGYGTDFDFPLIAAGQSYWMKTLQPKVLAPSGTPVTTATHTVDLPTGWSQVGNPFLSDVTWGNLQIRYNGQAMPIATAHANGLVREYGWTYDPSIGNYKLVDATRPNAERLMRSWLGYWVKALVPCQLVIPNPAGGSEEPPPPPPPPSPTVLAESVAGSGSASGYQVTLSVSSGELRDEAYLAFNSSAAERIESPTCLEQFVDVFFTDESGGMFACDFRTGMSHGESWQVGIVTDQPGEVVLKWSGLERLPRNVKLTLMDDETGRTVSMSPGSTYSFESSGYSNKTFRIRLEKTDR